MKDFRLFIDELGSANPKSIHPLYVLSGCSFQNSSRDDIKIRADQIKYKYWGHTNISFHSREFGKSLGDFSIFRNDDVLRQAFLRDLSTLLEKTPVILMSVVVDQAIARSKNWNKEKVLKESTHTLLRHFVSLLLSSKATGGIIIESATSEQDQYFLKAFQYYLSPNALKGIDYKDIQKALTSISFVTKRNNDIEEQIADIFAYAAKCKYDRDYKKLPVAAGSYEDQLLKIYEKKLFKAPIAAGTLKQLLYRQIDSFCVLTK